MKPFVKLQFRKNYCNLLKPLGAIMTFKTTFYYIVVYVQVRFELIYVSEISYLTVHLYEKVREDASCNMTLKQEIKKSHGRTLKRRTFKQEEEAD